MELPIFAYNGTVAIMALLLLGWAANLVVRFVALLRQRALIEQGSVVVLSEDDDHPEWMERAYIARLLNRRERVVPSVAIATLEVPFEVRSFSGTAQDPYTASAAAELECGNDGWRGSEFCFAFGLDRSCWAGLKERGLPSSFSAQKHAVSASGWNAIQASKDDGRRATVNSGECEMLPGKHRPQRDDVAVLLLLRRGDLTMAVTCASDARVLETVVFPPDGAAPLSVRDTFQEDDPDCVVCCARPKNAVLLPCRHCCCCTDCLARLDKCPVCRAAVESFVSFGELGEHVVAAVHDEGPDAIALQEIRREQ